jgi:hypothetical protein
VAGDARQLSMSQIGNLPREIQDAFRTIVEWHAETIDELNARLDRLTGTEGNLPKFDADGNLEDSEKAPPTGTIVGTTDEQTLTQKTLTSPTISEPTITNPTITDPDFSSADGSFEFAVGTADTDITLTFAGTTHNGILKWMEDEDYFLFVDGILIAAGKNIALATTTGTKIGTAATQLLGFWNATPVNQPDTVADATTQSLTGANTVSQANLESDLANIVAAINYIIARLKESGLIALT